MTTHVGGYVRIAAQNREDAETFLSDNSVYETGGTIEIRELPSDQTLVLVKRDRFPFAPDSGILSMC